MAVDFAERARLLLPLMVAGKARMKKAGVRTLHLPCVMPGCDGIIGMSLNGRKDHLHMRCDTCGASLME